MLQVLRLNVFKRPQAYGLRQLSEVMIGLKVGGIRVQVPQSKINIARSFATPLPLNWALTKVKKGK